MIADFLFKNLKKKTTTKKAKAAGLISHMLKPSNISPAALFFCVFLVFVSWFLEIIQTITWIVQFLWFFSGFSSQCLCCAYYVCKQSNQRGNGSSQCVFVPTLGLSKTISKAMTHHSVSLCLPLGLPNTINKAVAHHMMSLVKHNSV